MKNSRRKGFQVIRDRLVYGRKAPLQARKHERKRGRDLTWTLRGMPAPEWVAENWPGSATVLAVRCQGTRDGKPVDETRYYVTSLRTSAKALLQHVRDRWSIENSWHWPRDTQLREDAHRYREVNGVQIMATLRSLAMNALRLDGFWSITEGLVTGTCTALVLGRTLCTHEIVMTDEQGRRLSTVRPSRSRPSVCVLCIRLACSG